jgi:hypothetical protein
MSFRKFRPFLWSLIVCSLIAFTSVGRLSGTTIILTPDHDTYITSADSTSSSTNHNAQGIKIFDDPTWSNSWIQFDLNSIADQIVGVHLELYQVNEGNGLALATGTAIVDMPNGVVRIDETAFSRRRAIRGPNDVADSSIDDYQDFRVYGIGLGFTIPVGSLNGAYYSSDNANAMGVSLLVGRRTKAAAADRYALFNIDVAAAAGGGARFFDDKEAAGDFPSEFAPRLVVETIPEPSNLILMVLGAISVGFLRTGPRP